MIWIPAHRLLHVIDTHPNPARALRGKACERMLRELRSGNKQFASIRVADSLLSHLDRVHYWHLPADQGGLSDIYEDGAQYGAPDYSHTKQPRPSTRRYATEEERLAARRKTYRDSYRRRLERAAAA